MTAFLDDDYINVPQIRANKDEWIIKPTDHYGADDVYAGCYVSQEEWEGLIDKFANGRAGFPFIVQRYIRPFKTETLPPDTGIDQLTDERCPTPEAVQQPERIVPVRRRVPGRVQPPGAAAHDLEGHAGHDRRHDLGGLGTSARRGGGALPAQHAAGTSREERDER